MITAEAKTGAAVPDLIARLRGSFASGRTRPLAWRRQQLAAIEALLAEREAEILEALREDLGKPALEAFATEVAFTAGEARLARKKLRAWMRPERVRTSMLAQPGRSRVYREPLGVVLIIAPWNYPFQLAVGPLVGALAAGNCAVVKPSEIAPHTSALIARLLPTYLDPECVAVVEGGVPETTALLAEPFDYVFYTGNGTVGRIVMEAAARNLTPVTLELGGKSPCIVDRSADLAVTARRIAWGKFVNAGQTCVAPDYILAHEAIAEPLIERLTATITEFYGDDPRRSPDFARIVNVRHHRRLVGLLGSGEVVVGGKADEASRYVAPTILRNVPLDSPVMAEEIFGPILPVLTVPSVDAAIELVNARPRPLALYVFTGDGAVAQHVIDHTSSGGATINHAWLHLSVPGLPFGGVGASGMGAYHGRASFETFSHRKSVLAKGTAIDPRLVYPPYTAGKMKWVRRVM